MASIRQVAKAAGVSTATVSRVLNGSQSVAPELRSRVLRTASEWNYSPTVGKRTADRIALLYGDAFWVGSSPYDGACMQGVVSAMSGGDCDYDLVILDFVRDRHADESYAQFFRRKGICGAIVRSTLEQRQQVSAMADEGLAVVVLGDHFDHPTLPFCYADSRAASREAIEHLVSLGHEVIAFATCDREDGDHFDRYMAYKEVLTDAGLFDEKLVYRIPPSRLDGAPLIRRILARKNRPTAIFIADPMVAVGALNEALRLGVRVPDDLSIACVDDTDTRNVVVPRLTAVCQNTAQIGSHAFLMLQRAIEGRPVEDPTDDPPQAWYEIHETTASPPSAAASFLPTVSRASDIGNRT